MTTEDSNKTAVLTNIGGDPRITITTGMLEQHDVVLRAHAEGYDAKVATTTAGTLAYLFDIPVLALEFAVSASKGLAEIGSIAVGIGTKEDDVALDFRDKFGARDEHVIYIEQSLFDFFVAQSNESSKADDGEDARNITELLAQVTTLTETQRAQLRRK